MSDATHPGRSLDFLSRLHDGELSPAERAHFESHRAHCAECRKAAADFEQALTVYRTAGTSAPPPDLAAKILRRLEASNPRRSLFGVSFGIDLKWAGAFTAAALIAVIVGYAALDHRSSARQIPVTFTQPAAGGPAAPPSAANAPLRAKGKPEPRKAPGGTGIAPPPPAPSAARIDANAGSAPTADRLAHKEPEVQAARPTAGQSAATVAADSSFSAPPPVRILVDALDGAGAAPALRSGREWTLRAEDRGRYVLVLGADGVPLEVFAADSDEGKASRHLEKSVNASLLRLRFEPGRQTRRLLLRVE